MSGDVVNLTWARSVRIGNVRSAPMRVKGAHRGEVYGEQMADLNADWWRECHDCDDIVSYVTWDEAIYDAITHYRKHNEAPT